MLKNKNYHLPNLENIVVGKEVLDAFNIDEINLVALLWQSGYLTFDTVQQHPVTKKITYKMKVQNLEIQASLNRLFFNYLSNNSYTSDTAQISMIDALLDNNFDQFRDCVHTLFSSIVYNNHTGNNLCDFEGYYASVIFAYFSALGVPVVAEDHSSMGRADMTMFLPDSIIILSLKWI